MKYFENFENEFGLLENLESWIFVEWSAANEYEHTKGVNIPTNALYALALEKASFLLKDEIMLFKANEIHSNIIRLGDNGDFFVDNLIRNEMGELIKTSNLTEVTQYYLFWCETITKGTYLLLYKKLIT